MTDGEKDHFARCGQMATKALGLDDDHNSPDEVRAAIEQSMAIVSKLPVTADGVPVVESDVIWNPKYTDPFLVRAVLRMTSFCVSDCYSTREAVEAAEPKVTPL